MDRIANEKIIPELKAKILRRREKALAHPALLKLWGDTTETLRERLNEIRLQKIQAPAPKMRGCFRRKI